MATPKTRPASKAERPLIGLALGSGIARGWAHIGVIKRLREAGIEPDIIAGTSIGAVVGGAYATSQIDALEAFAQKLSTMRILRLADPRWGGGGLFAGEKLGRLLSHYLGKVRIESLPKTFIAVTTELATGHEIWMRDGPLSEAMRASYALPGIFEPVRHHDGRWLIDGALVNPVPASVCRAFGARLVIAVNLNRDAFGQADVGKQIEPTGQDRNALMRTIFGEGRKRDAPALTSVLFAALNIVQDRVARSRLAGDPPDVTIAPRLGHISLLDFDKADEVIEIGRAATEPLLERIQEMMARLS